MSTHQRNGDEAPEPPMSEHEDDEQECGHAPPRRGVLGRLVGESLVLHHGGSWMATWHAPWCRSCPRPLDGWRFAREPGYVSGFGFELSWVTAADAVGTER